MMADLMCEDKVLATTGCHDTSNNQGAITVVTDCLHGEQVWVRSHGNARAWGSGDEKFNVFSGVLLTPY